MSKPIKYTLRGGGLPLEAQTFLLIKSLQIILDIYYPPIFVLCLTTPKNPNDIHFSINTYLKLKLSELNESKFNCQD